MKTIICLLAITLLAGSESETFRKACAQKAATGEGMTIAGTDGWLFLRSELRHIGVGPFWNDEKSPMPAIVDFNDQLRKAGIELIVVPVPCKALIYPERLGGPAEGRLDATHQQFFKLLGEKGVKVVDLADTFLKEKAKPGSPILYCKTDSHWSPYACEVTARALRLQVTGKPDAFKTRAEKRTITGDLSDGKSTEELPARVIETPAAVEDKTSPILLLGDSHTLVFHAGAELHGTGAGLADQLAVEFGTPIDVIGVRGSGATPARLNLLRRVQADPSYLVGKKVVVWCFAAREFTEATGWRKVPIVK